VRPNSLIHWKPSGRQSSKSVYGYSCQNSPFKEFLKIEGLRILMEAVWKLKSAK
jgi:hypothetical protein